MSSTKGKNDPQRLDRDLYETPQWCVDIIANEVRNVVAIQRPFSDVVDLGSGDGRIGRTVWEEVNTGYHHRDKSGLVMLDIQPPPLGAVDAAPSRTRWMVQDYLDTPVTDLVSLAYPVLFVGNPPYSAADEFVMRTVDAMKKFPGVPHIAIFLLRMNWLGSEKRAAWVDTNPNDRQTILAPRPSFCVRETILEDGTVRKSSNDSCEYAWIWWENIRSPGQFTSVRVWPLSRAERKIWKAEQRKLQAGR